jgi:hypothetical protein
VGGVPRRPPPCGTPVSRLLRLPVVAGHLVARFVTSLSPRPPRIDDEVWAEDHLTSGELALWRQMTNQDRRHSASVARRFVARRPAATRDEIAGALLHDVGKIRCRLGTFGRSVATVVGPRTERFRAYHAHEEIGADLVSEAGSPRATVELVAGTGPAFADLKASDHA